MPTIEQCIRQVEAVTANRNDDECHESTRTISRALTGRAFETCTGGTMATLTAAIERTAANDLHQVYRVDLPGIGHSFAVIQCGKSVAVMQSWINQYSLQQWLDRAPSVKNNPLLPGDPATDSKILLLYLETLAQAFQTNNLKNMLFFSETMFGVSGAQKSVLGMKLHAAGASALIVRWESAAITALA